MGKEFNSSWDPIATWYDQAVGEKGHYYHEKVIIPKTLQLMNIKDGPGCKVLDLACGQAVFSRYLPNKVPYLGIDISKHLISSAKNRAKNPNHRFLVHDLTKPLDLGEKDFTHALISLALQNIENPLQLFKNVALHLKKAGLFIIIINHPCFRIPRQSSWGIDLEKKLQYRRIDRYLTEMTVPINAHPGKKEAEVHTLSFHHPISSYSKWLKQADFYIDQIEEWCSDKISTGKMAKMENRARSEFPLFLTFCATKK